MCARANDPIGPTAPIYTTIITTSVAIDEPDLDKSSLKPVMSQLEKHIAEAEAQKGEGAPRRKPLTVGVAGGSGSGAFAWPAAWMRACLP